MNRGDVCISILVSVVLIPPWQGNVLKVAHCCYVIGPYSIGGSIPHGLLLFFNFFVGDFSVSNTCAPGSHNITHSYCFKTPGKSYAFCMRFFKMCVDHFDQSLTSVLFIIICCFLGSSVQMERFIPQCSSSSSSCLFKNKGPLIKWKRLAYFIDVNKVQL